MTIKSKRAKKVNEFKEAKAEMPLPVDVVPPVAPPVDGSPQAMLPKPENLSPVASSFWDSLVNPGLSLPEQAVVVLMCRWLDIALTRTSEDNLVPAGIASDKFFFLATKFGLTPSDRSKAGVKTERIKPQPKRKRSIDEFTPDIMKELLNEALTTPNPVDKRGSDGVSQELPAEVRDTPGDVQG